jgi:enediyne biosynthesis protein E4
MSTVDAEQTVSAVPISRTSRVAISLVGMGALSLLWGGWLWRADRSYRTAILAIELEMANGRFGIAARELNKLLDQNPADAEAAILLGRCEKERGRIKAAGEALARVDPGSALSHKAILARMRLFHDQGQFASAEQLIADAALDPRAERSHLRVLLVPIFSQLGRLDESQRLLEEWWDDLNRHGEGASERAIDQVRMHIELEFKPNPVDDARAYLAQAYALAPGDDRVWLGRANLAIRTGDYKEAMRLLDACRERRPEDVPVWLAFFRLGMASNHEEQVKQALAHLPSDALGTAGIHRLRAWICARRGDLESERRELESLAAVDPADVNALDRLARLTEKSGQTERIRELVAKKAEIEALRVRYEKLFDRNQPIRDAEEMAQIAQRLGRIFEARAFLTVEISQDPSRADLRKTLEQLASQASAKSLPTARTLAEVMARESRGDDKVDATSLH